ncbi:hypothetical protein GIB67_020154 [Kingdonia uniflora]|uniref:Uncharacterized protein n=1 Tax=Kingdonia uniflora TaxID=39325 RepID=A0A7J7NIA5_9MAGN|nr:hypothetical protein GIB67_020154 [Kingdonia uniflora]
MNSRVGPINSTLGTDCSHFISPRNFEGDSLCSAIVDLSITGSEETVMLIKRAKLVKERNLEAARRQDRDSFHDPHFGLRIARIDFKKPCLLCSQYELIVLAIMQLLIKYVYNQEFKYAKFTIGYIMKVPPGDVPYIIGSTTSLNGNSIGNAHPNMTIYDQILNFLKVKAVNYDGLFLSAVFIRMYSINMVVKELVLSSDEIDSQIWDLLSSGLSGGIPQEVLTIARGRKRSYKTYITAIKPLIKGIKSFIVADLETILVNSIHKPYAAGCLVVEQGIEI